MSLLSHVPTEANFTESIASSRVLANLTQSSSQSSKSKFLRKVYDDLQLDALWALESQLSLQLGCQKCFFIKKSDRGYEILTSKFQHLLLSTDSKTDQANDYQPSPQKRIFFQVFLLFAFSFLTNFNGFEFSV